MPAASRPATHSRHVFISHSSEDAAVADKVCGALESAGLATWICSRDIQPGQTWAGAISDGLERSGVLVLLFTANANNSDYVLREVNLAVKQKVPILPVRLDGTPISRDMEFYIDVAHWISVTDGHIDPHLDKIADGCRNLLAPRAETSPKPTASRTKKPAPVLATASGPNILVPRHHTATTPDTILRLVERFEQHREAYKAGTYNEAHVRRDFIEPFFFELGWDVDNRAGYAEAYRDVIHEDSVKVAGSLRAPDYGFRIGGQRKFFLEAKKPSVRVKDEIDPAYQLRRYAWSAKLPVSVLTDFEEFAVYDCRLRPMPNDPASKSRVLYYTFDSYTEKWEEIASIFAKDAVLRGSFDKFATTAKGKRGTSEVDNEFLATIEEWRSDLARNLALRNALLSQREINFAVQRIIDRIIFLRICEDRGTEDYGRLRRLTETKDIYPQLVALFRQADARYNSGLFHFSAERGRLETHDTLTPGLSIDDALLKKIIRGLYYPDSPYQFDVISADILGQVYEQFLGKVIRLTDNHQAKVEEKPEVKKAGGVYYTPTYIVDYIVKETVGPLIEGKTPKQIAEIRVLDPACGSGSFLIGAYQFLLDWYLNYYTKNDPERWAKGKNPALVPGKRGGWVLSIPERKRILTAHIYGVDIDSQAVEVTKLSLLLKVLEGETALNLQPELIQERVLPDLADNIKCGNSLIGSDFYAQPDLPEMDSDARLKINVFDWDGADGFPAIMTSGGFDAIVGNPPYVRMEAFKPLKAYLAAKYASHEERADLYSYLVERSLSLLNKHGRFGMIISNKFMKAKYGSGLRKVLEEKATINVIADFAGANVFEGATVRTAVILAQQKQEKPTPVLYAPAPDKESLDMLISHALSVKDFVQRNMRQLPENALKTSGWNFADQEQSQLLDKIRTQGVRLASWVGREVLFGIKTGLNEAFIVDPQQRDAIKAADPTSETVLRPILVGRNIRRYFAEGGLQWIVYCHPQMDVADFPGAEAHLKPFRDALMKRATKQKWYELQQPAVALLDVIRKPKIVYPIIAKECRFCLDEDGYLINDKAFVLPSSDIALLAVMNSSVANLYFGSVCAALEGGADRYLEFRAQYVNEFPVPKRLAQNDERSELWRMGKRMTQLARERNTATTPQEKIAIEREMQSTSKSIDLEVYALYGLTEDEIKIVEAAN